MRTQDFGNYGVVYNEAFENVLPTLQDKSVDCVIIDPPYTDGKKDVLAGHKIQTVIDLDLVCSEVYRILKPDSFFAFFGQMPTIIAWYNAALKAGFKFRIDIVWAKRIASSPYHKVQRTKELIYIFSKGSPNYFKTSGTYEDIKMPLYLDGLLNIETLYRNYSELKYELKSGAKRVMNIGRLKKNDPIYYNNATSKESRHIDHCNFSDIWSFLPHNKTEFNNEEFNIKHPTVKPLPLLVRLIELLTVEGATVLDCFLGSGTTALSAIQTKRNFIGVELFEEYFDIACQRIEKEIIKEKSKLF